MVYLIKTYPKGQVLWDWMNYYEHCDPKKTSSCHINMDISKQSLLCLTVSSCEAQRSAPEPEPAHENRRSSVRVANPTSTDREQGLYTHQNQRSTWHRPSHLFLEMVVTVVVSMSLIKWSEHWLSTWKIWQKGSSQIHNLLTPWALQPAGYSEWWKHCLSLLVKALCRNYFNVYWTKTELKGYVTP